MPKKYFKIELSDGSQIHVFFEAASGIIVNKDNHGIYSERFMKWLKK